MAVQQFECIDDTIYCEEYNRIVNRMGELKNRWSSVTMAEMAQKETLGRVRDITGELRSMDTMGEFGEELFKMLVKLIKVMNLVQVEFVLRSGGEMIEVL